ncbi:hypothetical protein MAR_035304 [Mya arenaria]|uniref:Uncharacterized protein n=1 Tax=Mya arenaria TaxID=6604 RepID=A0ABY7EJP8_MYAAR|nr:hypothetical protein MAR_035304 [Mya arenaria]
MPVRIKNNDKCANVDFPERTQAKLTLNIRYTLAFFRNSSRLQTLQRSVLLTRIAGCQSQSPIIFILPSMSRLPGTNITRLPVQRWMLWTNLNIRLNGNAITCKEGCKSDDIMFNTSYLCSKNGTLNHKASARVSYRQLNADLYCYVYNDIRIVCDHVTSNSDPYVVQKLMGLHREYRRGEALQI